MIIHFYISLCSSILAIAIGVIFRKKLDKSMSLILLLLVISFSSDFICFLMGKNGIHNLWVIQLYGLIETVILYFFFKSIMPHLANILGWVVGVILLIYLVDCLFISGPAQYNSYSKSLQAVVFIGFSLSYFYYVFTQELDILGSKSAEFISVIALLVYFTGAFFSFMLGSDFLTMINLGKTSIYHTWLIHNTANIFKNVILTFALWRATR